MRRGFGKRKARVRADQMFRIMLDILRFHVHDGERALSEVQGRHHGILYPLLILLRRFQTVHDQFDEMGLVPVKGGHLIEFAQLSVYPDLGISPLAHLLEKFLVMTFAALDHRCEKIALAVAVVLHDQGHYLLIGVTDHGPAGLGRIGGRCPRIQQTEEIVDFRDGTDGRAGVVAGGLLLDRDDRAQASDGLDFRLFQYAHEMFGICRQRIHVPPLTFGIYGIEGKGRLSASAESRDDDEAVAGNRQRNSFKIVGFRPFYFDMILLLVHRLTNIRNYS